MGLATAYKNLSIVLAGEPNNFDETLKYLNKAKNIARSIDSKCLEIICNNNTALLHFRDRNFESALTYLTDGRALAEIHLPQNDPLIMLLLY